MTIRTTIASIPLGLCFLLAGCGAAGDQQTADAKGEAKRKPGEERDAGLSRTEKSKTLPVNESLREIDKDLLADIDEVLKLLARVRSPWHQGIVGKQR